jgi:predicted transcriptional regulator
MSLREVTRRVGGDPEGVDSDVVALVDAGLIERATNGVLFAYDSVHVDFTPTKADGSSQAA